MSDERLTIDRLNDDGVVFLIMAIFDEDYGRYFKGQNKLDERFEDPMLLVFGGGVRIGNSYNGGYQLGIQMVHQYRKKITGL